MTLAVKYRPNTFDEVVEQTITTTILKKAIEARSFTNCYLFSGASGCGKTTCARIFANAINNNMGSPIEIDGAVVNGVDSIRAMIDNAMQRSLDSEYKIFIIDECQSLTPQAWQAFLKSLEECPKYTIFIFCTTEPQKLPDTILNRMQQYVFTPISTKAIYNRLCYICQQEQFTNYEAVCDLISKAVNGSMRNAITYLDQCSTYSKQLDIEVVKQLINTFSYEAVFKLTWALCQNNSAEIISIIESIFIKGQDLKSFLDWYINFVLDLIKYILFKGHLEVTNIPAYLNTPDNPVVQYTTEQIENSLAKFNYIIDQVLKLKTSVKYDANYKTTIIITLLHIANELQTI